MWFDRNQDGDRDAGEWPLPGVRVNLAADDGQADALRVRHDSEEPAARGVEPATQTVTGTDGSYRFTRLRPGAYIVTASVSTAGFSYSSDTDGSADWTVAVRATGSAAAEADFAGTGRGALTGTIFNSTTGTPISGADVTCRWAGLDDALSTTDDVLLTVDASTAGSFGLSALPYGQYSCSGRDPVTGLSSASALVSIDSPATARAELPIRTGATAPTLPRSGESLSWLIGLGGLLIAAGLAAAYWPSSRRRRSAAAGGRGRHARR